MVGEAPLIVTADVTSGTPSRDAEFARIALRALTSSQIPFAILHNENRIASGSFASDIDMVVDVEFSVLMRRIASPFRAAGIRPILAWPYDTGATTLFVSNLDATKGAQLDFLWDRTGRGKYGLDVRRLLSDVEVGTAFPRVSQVHELLYLARKRQVKEQWDECRMALERLSSTPDAAAEVNRVFVGWVREEMRLLMKGELVSTHLRPRRVVSEAGRMLRRIRRPTGAWIEVMGSEQANIAAEEIANRFGGILPHVGWGRRPWRAAKQVQWWASEVAPTRWRAGIYASSAHRAQKPAPDFRVYASEDLDSSITKVVNWLEQRVLP